MLKISQLILQLETITQDLEIIQDLQLETITQDLQLETIAQDRLLIDQHPLGIIQSQLEDLEAPKEDKGNIN